MSNNVKKSSIKKNYAYNLAYQIVALLTPLLVTPYLSRVLTSAGVGQYSFSFSIVTYFILFANLGFTYYAQREIAKQQDDQLKQSSLFWEIVILKTITSLISFLVLITLLFLGVFDYEYKVLLLILSIEVLSVVFDITFFFQGNEKFKTIAIRNVFIKCAGTALIFVFVKEKGDVWVYTLIQALMIFISYVSLWTCLRKQLVRVSIRNLNVLQHFLPAVKLFIPTIAISVYTMLDKTLIGIFIKGSFINEMGETVKYSDLENGYYELTEQIVKISLTIITCLGAVMIPRNSKTIAEGNIEEFKNNVYSVLRFVFFIGLPIVFGLLAVSKSFCPWYFGSNNEKFSNLMMLFSPLVIIIGVSNVLGLQFLIPLGLDKKYTISILSGAILNLTLNLVFIPLFWSYGAAFATVVAELLISSMMMFFARKTIALSIVLKSSIKSIISSIIMFVCVFFTSRFLESSINSTLLLIGEGILLYVALQFILKEKIVVEIFCKIKSYLNKR